MSKEAFLENLKHQYGLDIDIMIRDIQSYMPDLNEKKFREAFHFAAKAHDGQFRKENKPYIIHPVEAARILISMHADEDTLIAALMHDVPEDTSHTIAEIEEKFGKKVAFLVEGITKLSKVHFRSDMVTRQVESLKKFFIHSAEDPRIILIKLADRLHNMRTLQYLDKPEKRSRIARETLEIFVPIANLLGIEELKAELEDLCFRFLHPQEYELLSEHISQNRRKNNHILEEVIGLVQKELDKTQLKAAVYARQKNLYSLYKKTLALGKSIQDLEDVMALRILVPERDDCYKVLGILHSLFKPKPGKFKDYIAVPKGNGYQSLHTTVFGLHGYVTEFQIRTNQMHLEAEYGIAAHYFHNTPQRREKLEKDKRSYWVNKILEVQKSQHKNDAFLEDLKLDVLQDRIYVFTPAGDPIDLPKNASCIDFAYVIHSEIGHKAVKAEINSNTVPLTTILHTGDTVRIVTSHEWKEPSREWLSFAKTTIAKNKIREYFKRESRSAKIHIGRKLLQKEFDRAGVGLVQNIPSKKIRSLLKHYPQEHYTNTDDILAAIGDGSLSSLEVVNLLYFNHQDVQSISDSHPHTTVTIKIEVEQAQKRQIENILRTISSFNIPILKIKGGPSFFKQAAFIYKVTISVQSFKQLSQLLENLEQILGVKRIERTFFRHKISFLIFSTLTFLIWSIHPYLLYSSRDFFQTYPLIASAFLYGSLGMLFMMVFMLKRLIQRSFPELRETATLWMTTSILSFFVLVTFLAEFFFLDIELNLIFALAFIVTVLAYLGLEYIDYHDQNKT